MSLGAYSFDIWPWVEDFEDEDDNPVPPPELLTVAHGRVWWSDTTVLPDFE